jgi:hypothetical protein
MALLTLSVMLPVTRTSNAQGNGTVDLTRLPLGDGKISTQPEVGALFSCQTQFDPNAGGAFRVGPWIKADGTYDLTAKVNVDGAVAWQGTEFAMVTQGPIRRISGNGLPSHPTGIFPVARSDDAYQFDRNPNTIRGRQYTFDLPANPQLAAQPSCVNTATIGITVAGVPIFNALDLRGQDAVAHEIQDTCGGHPERGGTYHYHGVSDCLLQAAGTRSGLIGYALDGFGIYGPENADGTLISSADLDECHGMVGEVLWDGKLVEMYHYRLTYDYPYTVGCFRGTPLRLRQPPQRN